MSNSVWTIKHNRKNPNKSLLTNVCFTMDFPSNTGPDYVEWTLTAIAWIEISLQSIDHADSELYISQGRQPIDPGSWSTKETLSCRNPF